MGKETLDSMLDYLANEHLKQMILSNPTGKGERMKVRIRPFLLKGELAFQAEEQVGAQAFHKNLSVEELREYVTKLLTEEFRQADVLSSIGNATVLVSKKGAMTVKVKRTGQSGQAGQKIQAGREPQDKKEVQDKQKNPDNHQSAAKIQLSEDMLANLSHNRKKRYVLEEGTPVPFLVDLGVMTGEGKIVRTRYDKFRQINRFLEFVEDILPSLDKSKETTIVDFGCGKSYLTFAMYYYLHELKGYPVKMIGLDLKKDVINHCSQLAKQYGYDNLKFYHGDIASFEGTDHVDMVVTLHACDTATDFALAKAVRWGAKVILSVPCCQHELNKQMENELLKPVLQYGLIKERMAALYTDAIRAQILESQGYRTQILEFIDMEHTPKNILIRGVWDGKKKNNQKELEAITEFLHINPTLSQLL